MSHLKKMIFGVVAVLCSILTLNTAAYAATTTGDDTWSFAGSAYLWAAGVEGTSAEGDEIDVSFSDILEDLDGGIMGVIAARKGRWTLIADILYLSIHQETSSTAKLIGVPFKVDVDVKLEGFVWTFGAAYRVMESDSLNLDILAGARYFKLDVDVDAEIGTTKAKYSDSEDVLDGIIGLQAAVPLGERWYCSLYADVGTGDSKLTWQVWPGVGYRFESFDLVAGYRHLEWETDDGDTIDDINFNGPMLGFKTHF